MRPPVQLELHARTWGGRRAGAGRKRAGLRRGVAHLARPDHAARQPVHVTLRARRGLPSLREGSVFRVVRRALAQSSGRQLHVVHFSVQADHVHLIIEAETRGSLSRGVQGLAIRIARAVNRVLGRHGKLWGDRFHARPLTTPREVRNALVYVLQNWQKHIPGARGLDPCSSAAWFGGFRGAGETMPPWSPVMTPGTWLAAVGWRRCGSIAIGEGPVTRRPPR